MFIYLFIYYITTYPYINALRTLEDIEIVLINLNYKIMCYVVVVVVVVVIVNKIETKQIEEIGRKIACNRNNPNIS